MSSGLEIDVHASLPQEGGEAPNFAAHRPCVLRPALVFTGLIVYYSAQRLDQLSCSAFPVASSHQSLKRLHQNPRLFVFLGRELAAKLQEAVEVFDGVAMEALGLGLKSKECGGDVGLAGEAIEAEGEPVGAVLFEGDVDAVGELGSIEDEWLGGRRGKEQVCNG